MGMGQKGNAGNIEVNCLIVMGTIPIKNPRFRQEFGQE
jgi:hypothetical protein